jgi:succinate dehydrogenase/fumarate reductase flavoprotein subunit
MADSDRVVAELETEVLVVGGGLAALRCAYEARRLGARVAIAVKGRLGRSGSSAMTSAGYSAVIDPADEPQLHVEDTLLGGRGLNDARLVEILADEAPGRREELVALGGLLAHEADGSLVVHPSGDHTIPRTVVAASFRGLDLTLPLAAAVERVGCEIHERTMVLDVLCEGAGVLGAVCLRRGDDPGIVAIRAGTVVLATGGCGSLFAISSNPSDVTGDGYAIALRAGATLRDMEFVQFYPWRCVEPFNRGRMPIQPSTFKLGGRLLNSRKERFMETWDPERLESAGRDVSARAIYDQIRQGLDIRGGVLLDISRLSDEQWRTTNPRPAAWFESRRIDYRQTELILSPEAHFFMGGVVVDQQGRSEVAGLFAVGETAGGVHGANRLDSNAIPETRVFGERAGAAAAAAPRSVSRTEFDAALDRWLADQRNSTTMVGTTSEFVALRRELQAIAWRDLGIVREAGRLHRGLADVTRLLVSVCDLAPVDDAARLERSELIDLLLVAGCSFTSALKRTESRGAHFRSDYPERDDEHWGHALAVRGHAVDDLTVGPLALTV